MLSGKAPGASGAPGPHAARLTTPCARGYYRGHMDGQSSSPKRETPLGRALVRLFLARGHEAAAVDSTAPRWRGRVARRVQDAGPPSSSRGAAARPCPRPTLLSAARTASARSRRPWCLEPPSTAAGSPHDGPSVDIESAIDDLKGADLSRPGAARAVPAAAGRACSRLVCFSERRGRRPGARAGPGGPGGLAGACLARCSTPTRRSRCSSTGSRPAGVGPEECGGLHRQDRSRRRRAG